LNSCSLDLGSGSGILSILLSKIGFNSVHACEIDDFARQESLINLKKNLVQDKVKFVDFPSKLKTKYSLIVSNISGEYLEKNFGYIVSKLMERGIFIISGLNKSKKESFINLASIENIKILDVLVSGSWMAMIFEK
jgi:ribosomal protein L11 methyltransferase